MEGSAAVIVFDAGFRLADAGTYHAQRHCDYAMVVDGGTQMRWADLGDAGYFKATLDWSY